MNYDDNYEIWKKSQKLTKPFWDSYQILFKASTNNDANSGEELEEAYPDLEYLEFINITRKHQQERDKQKIVESKKNNVPDEYYLDVSQINTLVIENINEPPDASRKEHSSNLYGPEYERIRSMEHFLDETFNSKCQQLSPAYWPSLPINIKHYLKH